MAPQLLRCGLVGVVLSAAAFAQVGGRGPSTGPGASGGAGGPSLPGAGSTGTTQPGNSPFPGNYPNQNQIPELTRSPYFLTGKVVMDDGSPPPDFVNIQLVCFANTRTVGTTDAKGNFSVDLNDKNASMIAVDAGDDIGSIGPGTRGGLGGSGTRGGLGQLPYQNCELRAALAGFRSDSINLMNRRALDNPDLGRVFLHRLSNVEGLTISATTMMAPKDAKKAFDKGRDEEKKRKWDRAEREFQKATDEYPKFAAAWYELGRSQEELKDIEAARKSYQQALTLDSKFVSPYDALARLDARDEKWQDVADNTSRLLTLNPVDFPQAFLLNALANYHLRKFEAAEKSAQDGITVDSAHHFPQMNHLLGVLMAMRRDYSGAAQNMKAYLKFAPNAPDVDDVKKQLEEVEKLGGPEANKAPATATAAAPAPQN